MRPFVYRVSRALARLILLVWNRLRAEGAEHVPATGGVLLVANHASYIDPPVVGVLLRRPVHYLARSTLGNIGLAHRYLSALGVLFVDRDGSPREGLSAAIDALTAGKIVCIFPEGTRTRTGEMDEFKRGALLLLKRAPVPVVPVGLDGTFRALPRGRLFLRPARVTVRYGAPMTAEAVLAAGGIAELQRRVAVLAGQAVPVGSTAPTESSSAPEARSAAAPRSRAKAQPLPADGAAP